MRHQKLIRTFLCLALSGSAMGDYLCYYPGQPWGAFGDDKISDGCTWVAGEFQPHTHQHRCIKMGANHVRMAIFNNADVARGIDLDDCRNVMGHIRDVCHYGGTERHEHWYMVYVTQSKSAFLFLITNYTSLEPREGNPGDCV